MDAIQKELLEQVAGLHEIPTGAYNIRSNGASAARNCTEHIEIVTKEDKNGIDILTQLLYGARISLIIGVTTGLCVTLLGATLGIVSAYFGKVSAAVILNTINVLLVVPTTPLMMILSNLSSSYLMMIAVFTLFGWCGTARMVRAQVLSVMNMNYIRAAELAGGSRTYIMFRHIMPSVSHLLIMNCALSCAGFMIAEAGLSFIGIGDPSVIGISDINKPDFGDSVTINEGELPVFWPCGVTPQAAVMAAKPPIAITHAPGHMFITDVLNTSLMGQ